MAAVGSGEGAANLEGDWELRWTESGNKLKQDTRNDGSPEPSWLVRFEPNGWEFKVNMRLDGTGQWFDGQLLAWHPGKGTQSGPPAGATTAITMHYTLMLPWGTLNHVFCGRRAGPDDFVGFYENTVNAKGKPAGFNLRRIHP